MCMCVSRLYLCLPIGLQVFFLSAHMYNVHFSVCERRHLGPIWCRSSTSWQRRACLCISWSLSAWEPDWVGECVGACMFGSSMCARLRVFVEDRFYSAAPSVRTRLPRELSALFRHISVNQPVSLSLSVSSHLSSPSLSRAPLFPIAS